MEQDIEDNAWQILESHEDQPSSYVDATSFALMRRENVQRAALQAPIATRSCTRPDRSEERIRHRSRRTSDSKAAKTRRAR
jgi:hypothetical protein